MTGEARVQILVDRFAQGQAACRIGRIDPALWIACERYRAGITDQRTAQVDQELLDFARAQGLIDRP